MADAIRREEAGQISKKINECKMQLNKGNIFSCLVSFNEALESMVTINMLPSDEKQLIEEINVFQKTLSDSHLFREIYGPVSFRDNEVKTTMDFLKQLIMIKQEEILEQIKTQEAKDPLMKEEQAEDEVTRKAREARILIDKGDVAHAQDIIGDDEDVLSMIVQSFNCMGIDYRKQGIYDKALGEFKKALLIAPQDEGLFYNIARVYIDKKEWHLAEESINVSLRINEDFQEGIKILNYIKKQAH